MGSIFKNGGKSTNATGRKTNRSVNAGSKRNPNADLDTRIKRINSRMATVRGTLGSQSQYYNDILVAVSKTVGLDNAIIETDFATLDDNGKPKRAFTRISRAKNSGITEQQVSDLEAWFQRNPYAKAKKSAVEHAKRMRERASEMQEELEAAGIPVATPVPKGAITPNELKKASKDQRDKGLRMVDVVSYLYGYRDQNDAIPIEAKKALQVLTKSKNTKEEVDLVRVIQGMLEEKKNAGQITFEPTQPNYIQKKWYRRPKNIVDIWEE